MKTMLSFAAILACIGSGSAHAHATFANEPVKPEGTVVAVLQVPHGCGDKATTEVQMILPEGFISAKPQPKAGWDLEVVKGNYQKTYEDHGERVTGGTVEIRWKNGNLPDDFYDTFAVRGKVTGIEPGSTLPFKVIQLCGNDGKVAWDEIAAAGIDPHSLKNPAPVLRVADGAAVDEHAGHAAVSGHEAAAVKPAGTDTVKAGDITLTGGYTKAMLPGQPVGGGFITIANAGADDRLVSASSPVAGRVELHEMAMVNDVMKMRQLNDGIRVPAGQTVELKPGGLHLMFMGVKAPFVEGGTVALTLTFEKAGAVDVVLPVASARGK